MSIQNHWNILVCLKVSDKDCVPLIINQRVVGGFGGFLLSNIMVCRTHDPTRSSTISSSRPKQIISICLGDEEVKGDPLQCDLSSLSDISNKRLTSTSIRRRPCQKGEHLKKGPPKENPLKKMVHDNQEAFLLNLNANFEG